MYRIQFMSGKMWNNSGLEFQYSNDGRMNVGGRKVRMSPEAWAQCEFPELRNGGQWRLRKVKS